MLLIFVSWNRDFKITAFAFIVAFIVARFRIYFPVNIFEGIKSALGRDILLQSVYFIKCRQFISEIPKPIFVYRIGTTK